MKPGKPSEVVVVGVQFGLVLDRERGEVGVGDQIASGRCAREQVGKHIEMERAGCDDLCVRPREPRLSVPRCFDGGHPVEKDAPNGYQVQEAKQYGSSRE